MEEKKADEDTTMETSKPKTLRPSPSKVYSSFIAPYGPNLHVSNHPVLAHKLSILRSSSTSPASFRSTLREITFHLGYEATATLSTRDIPITVPGTNHTDHIEATGQKIAQKIALIPILRSGLGMVDSMLELVGDARVHHIGMYRSKSLMPVQYYNRLPKKCEVDVAYVLDPLIATSATVISVAGILKKVRDTCFLTFINWRLLIHVERMFVVLFAVSLVHRYLIYYYPVNLSLHLRKLNVIWPICVWSLIVFILSSLLHTFPELTFLQPDNTILLKVGCFPYSCHLSNSLRKGPVGTSQKPPWHPCHLRSYWWRIKCWRRRYAWTRRFGWSSVWNGASSRRWRGVGPSQQEEADW